MWNFKKRASPLGDALLGSAGDSVLVVVLILIVVLVLVAILVLVVVLVLILVLLVHLDVLRISF